MDRMRNKNVSVINYAFLDGVIPAKQGYILPSDLDGIIETNFHFLVFEWKRPDEELSKGQHIMLSRLASLPKFTVIVVKGHSNSDQTDVREFYQMKKDGTLEERGFGVDDLREKTKSWFMRSCGKYYFDPVEK
jgi:hypothetical protein